MEFSLDKQTIADPKKRFLFGVLMVVICIGCYFVANSFFGVTRESCLQVDATFDQCKSRSSQTSQGSITYYLTFEDHDNEYTIHPSCEEGHLIEDLLDLRSGAAVRLLIDESSQTIYELEVNGKLWLAFDDAKKQIEANIQLGLYIIYVCFAVGAVCIISSIISFLFFKKKKQQE